MKRIVSLSLAVFLVVALAIPAFATDYDGHTFPDVLPMMEKHPDYPLAIVTYQPDYNRFNLYLASVPVYLHSDGQLHSFDGESIPCITYKSSFSNPYWGSKASNSFIAISPDSGFVLISSDITDENGNIVIDKTPVYPECDGTSCSADDVDHNNVCDDCGRVLTYNLRSTLLSYAKTMAESYGSGYPYYAVMENPTTGNLRYNLYISKSPMQADVPNYDVAIGEAMQWTTVFTNDDGTFDRGTWASVESFTGNLVYANHTIENFREPPLAVIIQGVTGEAMETTLPNLYQTIRTILLCGVGCLAFLTVFHLLRSRLFPYLRR